MKKKIIKRIFFIVLSVLVIFTGVYIFLSFPMLTMKPVETGQVPCTDIFAIKNDMNSLFFIETGNGYIMIDAGTNPKKLETSMKETGINAGDVKWTFLTHSDYDHVAALAMFQNSNVYMSEDELAMVNGTVKRTLFSKNTMPDGIDIDKIILLKDQQEITCGALKVKCIKTPGHTAGSMVYLVDNRYLFTGDALKITKGKPGVHPFTMNKEQAKKTIEQMKGIIDSGTIVLTAHYGKL